ncbi:hypothetical protein C8R43DRAFT_957107 [Mycena crocata]|nr:hypothetical protein C8R43DRAFT_957107 [Mycena crocata]
MASISTITFSPALRFPSRLFFLVENQVIAEHWVGQLAGEDLSASYEGGTNDGGIFVYKTSPKQTRKVTRAFVYGEIEDIQDRIAETSDVGDQFYEFVPFLHGSVTIEEWALNSNRDHPEEGMIFVDCGPNTEFKTGHLGIGDCVLFDVSLHRYDTYPDGTSCISQILVRSQHNKSWSWLNKEWERWDWRETRLCRRKQRRCN